MIAIIFDTSSKTSGITNEGIMTLTMYLGSPWLIAMSMLKRALRMRYDFSIKIVTVISSYKATPTKGHPFSQARFQMH